MLITHLKLLLNYYCLINKAPILSHVLYTHVLNDYNEDERRIGIDAGLSIGKYAEESIVCIDRGLSSGMEYAINSSIRIQVLLFYFYLKISKPKKKLKFKDIRRNKRMGKEKYEINKDHYNQTGYIIKI